MKINLRQSLMSTQAIKLFFALPLLGFLLLFSSAKPAQADPHAMFYTTVGQQQLFFNILAALDQADYVEPANPSLGISTGNSREELLDKRKTAGFGPANDARLGATTTELSSLVTRAVTLEGYDVWTAYLLYQFSLEAARRTAVDEVVRVYCKMGLGLTKCLEETDAAGVSAKDQQKEAFVVNPLERNADVKSLAINAILGSNADPGSYYQNVAEILEFQNIDDEFSQQQRNSPYPYDIALATLRQGADSIQKSTAIDRVTETARRSLDATRVDPSTFDDIYIDPNGDVTLQTNDEENSISYINRYIDKVTGLFDFPLAAQSTARRGAAIAEQYLAATENNGAVAQVDAEPISGRQGRSAQIEVPAHVKIAQTQAVVDSLPSTEESLTSAPAEAEHIPGTTELVDRGTTAGATTSNVLGATSSESTAAQEPAYIAGITSNTENSTEYHTPTTPYNPNVNPIHFHHEDGPDDLLRVLGYNIEKYGCGCRAQNFVAQFGTQILSNI